MLSALQLHRKTIKFQKPDTTQGGITFKARYCLLFSVLNKILRVGASGWFIMNRDSVHMICRPSPWREGLLFTGYLTRRFLASSADAQSWPVKYCAASSHSCSLHWTPPSYHMIQIGSKTPILPPAWVLLQQTSPAEIIQCPLDRRAGKPQLQSNGSDGRPAASLAVCPILEVHIDALGSVA